jgi:hypothetical protein
MSQISPLGEDIIGGSRIERLLAQCKSADLTTSRTSSLLVLQLGG